MHTGVVGCAASPGLKGVKGLCGDQVLSQRQRMAEMDDAERVMRGLLSLCWVPRCGSACAGVTPALCQLSAR